MGERNGYSESCTSQVWAVLKVHSTVSDTVMEPSACGTAVSKCYWYLHSDSLEGNMLFGQ